MTDVEPYKMSGIRDMPSEVEFEEAKPTNLPRQDIEAIADAWSRASGYDPSMSSLDLVARFGGRLIPSDSVDELEKESIRVWGPKNFEIRVPLFTSSISDRYTVAHELGHYLLHYMWPLHHGGNPKPIFASRYGSGKAEDEANWFACAFLMRKDLFTQEWDRHEKSVSATAAVLHVSTADVYSRAQQLGFVS